MKLRLLVRDNGAPSKTIDLDETKVFRIGRDDDNDLVLEDRKISKQHAIIRPASGGLVLVDAGSMNGLWIGKVSLHAGVERLLVPGARIRMGTSVTFEVRERPLTATGTTAELALKLVAAVRTRPLLIVVEGPDRGASHSLEPGDVVVVGRAKDATLRLSDEKVSTRHFEVRSSPGGIEVRDLESRHGTHLGDRLLVPKTWDVWDPVMQVELGSTVLAIVPTSEVGPPSLRSGSPPEPSLPGAAANEQAVAALPPASATPGGAAPVAEVPANASAPDPLKQASSPGFRRLPYVGVAVFVVLCLAGLVWIFAGGGAEPGGR